MVDIIQNFYLHIKITQRQVVKNTKMDNKNILTTGSVRKKMLLFALPIFLGNLFQQLYNTADSIIVGNFIGSNALAAVTSAGNLIFLVVGFFSGISVGAGVVISYHIGAQDEKRTKQAVHTTVALGLVASVIMTVIGIAFAPAVLRLMNTPAEVLPQSVIYFRVYFAGSFGLIMYNTFMSVIQASGDSRTPFIYLLISSVMNVALDLILIAGFHMGVGAAAFATAVAQLFCAFLAMRKLLQTPGITRLVLRDIRFEKTMLSRVLKMGLPTGLQNSIMGLSNVVIQSYINGYGESAVAGIGAYTKVEGFVFIPIMGFTMAMTTFISQNLGAGEYKRVKQGIRFGIAGALISAECIGILLYFAAPSAVALFDRTPEVIAYGVARAQWVTPFFFLCALTHAGSAILRGYGRAVTAMNVSLICWCVMRILFLAIFDPVFHTITLTNIVYPITWTISSVTLVILLLRMFKKQAQRG